ncbi:hypothetical protein ACFQZX_03890 [Mucilaginibacter litoreus]|uniref:Uncharacterized protein n=1 Tax=Mucilaginibacter litoreus TaxID=1048221 RepID=A0ABW3ANZ2_9SPHI
MNSDSVIKTYKPTLFFLLILICLISCKQGAIVKHDGEKDRISFKWVFGIRYIEVARRLDNGLSFNEYGYQLEPNWQIKFIPNDSASIYSPKKKQYINFPLSRGYDSIFVTAGSFFKVKKLTRDSMLLQLVETNADSIDLRGANVYMTFYSDKFIKNVLHKDTAAIKAPSKRDTIFIKSLIDSAEKDYQKAFFARQPASVTSKSSFIKVKPRKVVPDIYNNFQTTDDYMYPTFNITIERVPADFYYSFSVVVDSKGKLHYDKPMIPVRDDDIYTLRSKVVMNKYLKRYLKARPGTTLGLRHPSNIYFHVEGLSHP